MNIHAIYGDEVCVVKCVKVEGMGVDGEVFKIQVLPSHKLALLGENLVTISRTLINSNIEYELFNTYTLGPEQQYLLAIRASRRLKTSGEKLINVHTENYRGLFEFNIDPAIIDEEIKRIYFNLGRKHPGIEVTQRVPFISTNYTRPDIQRSLGYLVETGILLPGSLYRESPDFSHLVGYKLSIDGFKEITSKKDIPALPQFNKYFKIVDIPKLRGKKFSFVIMPFRNSQIDQKTYTDLIKPIFENKSGFECIRSDKISTPGIINDHIFTCIERCEFVVAELSKANRNVDTELGIAIRANKPIFILTTKRLDKTFFDIRNFRQIRYKGFEDLRNKLEGLELEY